LAGGVSITNSTGTLVRRQTFLYFPGVPQPIGSVEATETFAFDNQRNVIRRHLVGKFQAGIPGSDEESPQVCVGSFATGRRFVPLSP
jgi:hypothetical protein